MTAATLFLGIPPILLTVPPIPLPSFLRRRTTSLPLSKIVVFIIVVLFSVLPNGSASAVISDVLLVLALFGSYVIPCKSTPSSLIDVHDASHAADVHIRMVLLLTPVLSCPVSALLHITVHHFKRPHSIVLPQSLTANGNGHAADPADELLQRKERTLQRRRLGRRLAFDVLAWVVVVGVGGIGIVWGVERLMGNW